MFKHFRQFLTFFKDEYRKHLFKNKVSYLVNYYKLSYISFIKRETGIVAISLVEHIGDIIAAEPIAREIRKKHPRSTIIWFVRSSYTELVKYNPSVNMVFNVFCLTTWILIKRKIDFEAVYDLHFNGRTCNICQWVLRKENIDDSINSTNYFNFGGLLKAVCLHNKIEVSDSKPVIHIPAKVIKSVEQHVPLNDYVVIHCKSNEAIKDWDTEKWDNLVLKIIDECNIQVVEIGSLSEIKMSSLNYHNLCGKLSLLQSAAVIKKAKLFIGIDSGPAQMANALDVPGIILLGEYYFGMKYYNPYSGNYGSLKNCRLVYSDNWVKNISVEKVSENFKSLLTETTTP